MTFQAYLDTIKEKTGKGPKEFVELAAKKGLTQHAEIVKWLQEDYGLGTGHARALVMVIKQANEGRPTAEDALAKHFAGAKVAWQKPYTALAGKLAKFGPDVKLAANQTYINLQRGGKKFGIVQISAADRMDVGIKLKGLKPIGRLEAAGSWNAMVTHRVKITDPKQLDAELVDWLKQAYEAAA
jgi:hypothetical protein